MMKEAKHTLSTNGQSFIQIHNTSSALLLDLLAASSLTKHLRLKDCSLQFMHFAVPSFVRCHHKFPSYVCYILYRPEKIINI